MTTSVAVPLQSDNVTQPSTIDSNFEHDCTRIGESSSQMNATEYDIDFGYGFHNNEGCQENQDSSGY